MSPSIDFTGKTVLVTGGASGIGAAVSRAFGRQGANVALTYSTSRSEAEAIVQEIGALGGQALAMQADLSQQAEVDGVFASVIDRFGAIDVLFTNAGGLIKRERSVDASLDLWSDVMDINLTSTFLCCRAALSHMEPRKSGAIVTMASQAAFDGGGFGASAYAASKGAVVSYTRALAKEVGPLGIRVNGVAPGLIATRFHDTFNTPEGRERTVGMTPLRREGQPEDVAGVVLFLASDLAGFLAGEIIQVNGGLALI
jgi:3-oxoacyl-[acyl-carrier protein] reductase